MTEEHHVKNTKLPVPFNRNYTGVVSIISMVLVYCTSNFMEDGQLKNALIYLSPVLATVLAYPIFFLLVLVPSADEVSVRVKTWRIKRLVTEQMKLVECPLEKERLSKLLLKKNSELIEKFIKQLE